MTQVTTISPADRERAVATLTLAFVHDPVVRWVFRDPLAFSVHWPRLVDGPPVGLRPGRRTSPPWPFRPPT